VKLASNHGLAVPLKDVGGQLRGVMHIDAAGQRSRVVDAADGLPLMHVIDPERRLGYDTIVVSTDYAAAAAIHRATRQPVVMVGAPER
jgi:hypothetical protein